MAPSVVDAGPVSPAFFTPLATDSNRRPRLCVVVDTEEEFDWYAPLSRRNVDVSAINEVGRLQTVLSRFGLTPTYMIDYPVAATPSSAERMSDMAHRGHCHIGAHLHPWVNPPYVEQVGPRNSYACNLGFDIERDKLTILRDAITEHVGVRPRSYKAGRYGFGRSTARLLESLDFDLDLSVNPHMNFESDGGPSFEGFEATLSRFGEARRLLEVPCTTGFIGAARRVGTGLHRAASARWLEPFHAVGVLAASGLLNKVMLSPEGNTLDEMTALTETLYAEGIRTFSLTLHSPSMKPGCTPYVRTVQEREDFLVTIDKYCDYFMSRLKGVPTTPAELFDALEGDAA